MSAAISLWPGNGVADCSTARVVRVICRGISAKGAREQIGFFTCSSKEFEGQIGNGKLGAARGARVLDREQAGERLRGTRHFPTALTVRFVDKDAKQIYETTNRKP